MPFLRQSTIDAMLSDARADVIADYERRLTAAERDAGRERAERIRIQGELEVAQSALAKFDRTRGERGRFAKVAA